ncbi:hypothetical protein NA57DRAFT_78479 [Rhizodiscina lignyota]|uniref:Programmed cell death protein 2 C-terminal domain-containing protein n=1 Tax=Rhizodiscina lignyota TaxID=1504668 RepID=A0A9P4ID96_9PEZI|nr:hypothetical protein NA57DRAFT_78479 [Rhizodiscina lignyota]
MASYDSDSSLDDEGNYTETSVLLGYASQGSTEDTVSQLGGYPTWLDDKTTPPGDLAKCKICNDLMTLMLQLNGNLPERFPDHERRLYLFTCRRKPCRRKEGSIRGFRGTKITKATTYGKPQQLGLSSGAEAGEKPKQPDLGAALFGVAPSSGSTTAGANPFSTSTPKTQSNPFSTASSLAAKPPQKPTQDDATNGLSETFADKVRLSSPPPPAQPVGLLEAWPAQSSFPRPFTCYSLDADYETLSEETPAASTRANVTEMDIDGASSNTGGGGGNEDKDLFESSMDKTFQRFADRLSHNPEQALRYEFNGQPLLYSSTDAVGRRFTHSSSQSTAAKVVTSGGVGIPSCQNCGAKRTFELQLTPHAIEMLETDEPANAALEGMDWGTVILGVCEKDCGAKNAKVGEVGYLEEWVGVQWEELSGSGRK